PAPLRAHGLPARRRTRPIPPRQRLHGRRRLFCHAPRIARHRLRGEPAGHPVTARPAAPVEVAPPSSEPPPSEATVGRRVRGTWRPPLSVALLAFPAVVAVVRLFRVAHHPFDLFGDEAILESAVRHIGGQLVGPYSRFGFHQPGPAYFYLQAPFYRSPGASAAALFLGAFCINLGAALG